MPSKRKGPPKVTSVPIRKGDVVSWLDEGRRTVGVVVADGSCGCWHVDSNTVEVRPRMQKVPLMSELRTISEVRRVMKRELVERYWEYL